MLYYHFGSKAGLYRAAIQLRLGALADHLESVASSSRPAFERLDDYIAAGSGVEGWNPTDTSYAVADAPLGPYREMGRMDGGCPA